MSSPPWELGPWELRIVEILANIILYFVLDSEHRDLDPTRLGNVFSGSNKPIARFPVFQILIRPTLD
jgi:hypothetical protein